MPAMLSVNIPMDYTLIKEYRHEHKMKCSVCGCLCHIVRLKLHHGVPGNLVVKSEAQF